MIKPHSQAFTYKKILIFWVPLAATWLMMAAEGPVLTAVIARLANPKSNLAAFGVAFSFAILVEAPVIMILSASTALVKDKDSFRKLRNFTYILNASLTAIMAILLLPPVFHFLTIQVIGLPEEVKNLTHSACIIMLPWPGAIGYRRFYQGILIRSNLTRLVAWGTVTRLTTMFFTALFCYLFFNLNGSAVGALALTIGVTSEAVASKIMSYSSVKKIRQQKFLPAREGPLTYRSIAKFYYPLALTSLLGLGIYPIMTFFMGQSRMPLESLAVLPVVNALVFVFQSLGFSYQEVSIALLGENNEGYTKLRNFATTLGIGVSGGLTVVAFSPLSLMWFHKVSGLSLSLSQFAISPTKILSLIPALTVLVSFQRALLVAKRRTLPITVGTALEVIGLIGQLLLTIHVFQLTGVIGAALAMISGRVLANIYLHIAIIKERKAPPPKAWDHQIYFPPEDKH